VELLFGGDEPSYTLNAGEEAHLMGL
jgi:hypothetical protein